MATKTIKYKISWQEDKPLYEQDELFTKWIEENVAKKIKDDTKSDLVDIYGRPSSYSFTVKGFKIIVSPVYRFSSSDPSIMNYNITIK